MSNQSKLKSEVKKNKTLHINDRSMSIYRQRLSREKWLKINHRRMIIFYTVFFISSFFITTLLSNIFGVYVFNNLENGLYINELWNPIWLVKPYPTWWGYMMLGIGIVGITLLPTLFFRKFLKLKYLKNNWVESEESGTAHFLTDERNPWTMQPKLEAQYYPRTYFLDKGDWIIRLDNTKDLDTFLDQATKFFHFNQENGSDLDKLLVDLKIPTGTYGEPIKLTSANDVITIIKNKSQQNLKQNEHEFKSKIKNFLINMKLNPIVIQTAGDSPNAYVLGGTGSGKTTKLNYPTIWANANAIQQPSFAISDPKGELYATLSGYLSAMGYDVFSLDLFDLVRSQGWNPFQDVYQKFVAKGVLKHYLKQYDEAQIYFNVELYEDENKSDDSLQKLDEIKNEFIHKGFIRTLNDEDIKQNRDRHRLYTKSKGTMNDKEEFIFNHDYLRNFYKTYKLKYDEPTYQDLKFNDENEIKITLEKMYEEIFEYIKSKIQRDVNALKLKWKNDTPIINETIGIEYPLWTYDEYLIIDERMKRLNIKSLEEFKFDDSFITNEYYLKHKDLLYPRVIGNDNKVLENYVCSIHTATHAHLECLCHASHDRSDNILFDNYVFKTRSALKLHFNTTLNTQISEQIRIIQNAIFHSEKSDHWIESAGKVFGGTLFHFGYKVEDDINSIPLNKFNISSLAILTANDNDFNEDAFFNELSYLQTLNNTKNNLSEYENALISLRIQELSSRSDYVFLNPIFTTADSERGSIKSTFSTKMAPFLSDGVKLLTTFSDIKFEELINPSKPRAIFLGINVNDPTYHPFIVLFISILHQKLSEKAKKSGGALKRYFLFMLDEFGNIPAIPNYGKILSTCRSENMKFMSIVQSNAQIEKIYEKDKDNIITNKGLNVYIKSDDYNTAKYYSDLLGTTTYDVSKSMSMKEGWLTEKKDFKQRSLMTPDEIKNIDSKEYHDTIFFSQSKPIIVQVKPWYKIFNTKDFGTYRPIQFLPNACQIKKNQLNYRKDIYKEYKNNDDNYILNFYAIREVEELIDLNKVNQEDDSDTTIQDFNQLQNELSKQNIKNKVTLIEHLIKTFHIQFYDQSGKTIEEFKNDLTINLKDVQSLEYLYQNFALTNGFNYNFSEEDFKKIMFEFIDEIENNKSKDSTYVVETKKKYKYKYVNHDVNNLIIDMANEYLTSPNKNDTYIELKQILNEHTYLVDNTVNMISLLHNWEFLSRYNQESLREDNLLQTLSKWTSNFVDDRQHYNTPMTKMFYDLLKEVDSYFYYSLKQQGIYNDKLEFFDWNKQDNEWFYENHIKPKDINVSINHYQILINQLLENNPSGVETPNESIELMNSIKEFSEIKSLHDELSDDENDDEYEQ